MTDWDRSVRHIEQARPSWPPGQVPAYHYISYGFILGELVRRVSGAAVPDLLAAEFLGPLGLRDIHLGLPADLWPRRVPIRGRGLAGRVSQAYVNRRDVRQAVIPAAGISATARDLARFLKLPMRWSQGFQLGGGPGPAAARPMGQLAGPQTFGHNGSNCCLAWADPARQLVFVYLTDLLTAGSEGACHQGQVSDAVIAACS
jgi:CubicO group peptidase (beta-lactamase class C family)